MPSLDEAFPKILSALEERYGRPERRDEAPADRFRAILAVTLERWFDARKVARALERLSDAGLLELEALARADAAELRDLLRESGFGAPAKPAAQLQRLARWLVDQHDSSAEGLDDPDAIATESLRDELSSLNGIGASTADAILLFALNRPVYPITSADYRIFLRHRWLDPSADYDEARSVVEGRCSDDPRTLRDLAAWIEHIGRDYCRSRVAKCEQCPLKPFLPPGGPWSWE